MIKNNYKNLLIYYQKSCIIKIEGYPCHFLHIHVIRKYNIASIIIHMTLYQETFPGVSIMLLATT